jgi:hypothetical protein
MPVGAGPGRLSGVTQATKEEARRERLREYDQAVAAARPPIGVLALFVTGREARARGEALEEAFAVAVAEGVDDAHRLPAAMWVALRQGDLDAAVELLVRRSRHEVVITAHEELDAGYRLTTVEERRALPDVDLLEVQLAAFLQIPRDVITIITGWGPDDPRSGVEIETLLEQRFGPRPVGRPRPAPVADRHPAATSDPEPKPRSRPRAAAQAKAPRAGLVMSSGEFGAMLSLAPDQSQVLEMLVRQADITIIDGGPTPLS